MNTILIVDDQPELLEMLRIILTSKGYKVITAKTATEGLQRFKENPSIKMVLSDILCAGGDSEYDGISLGKELRMHYKNLVIILMTGDPGHHEMEELNEVTPYILYKPFNIPNLFGVLANALLMEKRTHREQRVSA